MFKSHSHFVQTETVTTNEISHETEMMELYNQIHQHVTICKTELDACALHVKEIKNLVNAWDEQINENDRKLQEIISGQQEIAKQLQELMQQQEECNQNLEVEDSGLFKSLSKDVRFVANTNPVSPFWSFPSVIQKANCDVDSSFLPVQNSLKND